ncbi:MAG: hypothetical protein UDB11_11395 [Peptococcaceae bacterium]|nr:hypothetical protein [Peptococcaceae bacterium]
MDFLVEDVVFTKRGCVKKFYACGKVFFTFWGYVENCLKSRQIQVLILLRLWKAPAELLKSLLKSAPKRFLNGVSEGAKMKFVCYDYESMICDDLFSTAHSSTFCGKVVSSNKNWRNHYGATLYAGVANSPHAD